ETVVPSAGAVIDTAGIAVSVLSAAVMTSKFVVPSVQITPIWLPVARGYPLMKPRVCVPLPVPGTVVHGVHAAPLNRLYKIELAPSLLMQKSQMFVPSVAPNRPPPPRGFCPAVNRGGAAAIGLQPFDAGRYLAPSTAVPEALRRKA